MRHNLFLGLVLTLVGAFFYSSQMAFVKVAATSLPPLPVVIFIQSAVSFILILPFLYRGGLAGKLITKQPGLQVLRTVFSLGLSYTLFYAVQFIPLVNAILLVNCTPLLIPFLAYFFMKQKINHKLWVPIFIGFLGVVVTLHPQGKMFHPADFLALGAALLMGATMLCVRKLSATDSSETTALYFFFLSTLLSGIVAIPFWVPMTLKMWIMAVMMGVLYFVTQYIITNALRYMSAQLFSALMYINIVYAAGYSIILWGVYPTYLTILGMILIIFGGILCMRLEHRIQRRVVNNE